MPLRWLGFLGLFWEASSVIVAAVFLAVFKSYPRRWRVFLGRAVLDNYGKAYGEHKTIAGKQRKT